MESGGAEERHRNTEADRLLGVLAEGSRFFYSFGSENLPFFSDILYNEGVITYYFVGFGDTLPVMTMVLSRWFGV